MSQECEHKNAVNEEAELEVREQPQEEEAAPTTKICPFCKSEIPVEAVRCPHCTSHLDGTEA